MKTVGCFYNVITPDQYTVDGVEVDKINIDCEVYYNGAKGSGCAIDIGVRAISLYRGDLTAEEDEESENTTKIHTKLIVLYGR